jgi:hypothetical protein
MKTRISKKQWSAMGGLQNSKLSRRDAKRHRRTYVETIRLACEQYLATAKEGQ